MSTCERIETTIDWCRPACVFVCFLLRWRWRWHWRMGSIVWVLQFPVHWCQVRAYKIITVTYKSLQQSPFSLCYTLARKTSLTSLWAGTIGRCSQERLCRSADKASRPWLWSQGLRETRQPSASLNMYILPGLTQYLKVNPKPQSFQQETMLPLSRRTQFEIITKSIKLYFLLKMTVSLTKIHF